jgi:hypothetical protein
MSEINIAMDIVIENYLKFYRRVKMKKDVYGIISCCKVVLREKKL